MMSKKYFFSIMAVYFLIAINTKAQDKYFTKDGKITFEAVHHGDIHAISRSAAVIFNTATGEFQFTILIKSFEFEKAYMQEKFNQKILETDQFPKAEFKGIMNNASSINYQKDGDYPVEVKGNLTLHGVANEITVKGTLSIRKASLVAKSTFNVSIDNYNIPNPGIGNGNIEITVDCHLEQMKN